MYFVVTIHNDHASAAPGCEASGVNTAAVVPNVLTEGLSLRIHIMVAEKSQHSEISSQTITARNLCGYQIDLVSLNIRTG